MKPNCTITSMDDSQAKSDGVNNSQAKSDLKSTNSSIVNKTTSHSSDNNIRKQHENENPSPSKGKNRKRNEARKRNANQKKSEASKSNNSSDIPNSNSPTIVPKDISESSPKTQLEHKTMPNETLPLNQTDSNKDNDCNKTAKSNANNARVKENELDKERIKEFKKMKEQLKLQTNQVHNLVEQVKQQLTKTKEQETALIHATLLRKQLEDRLKEEMTRKNRLESEYNQTISSLRAKIEDHEKTEFNNQEMIRSLNATLMERETEVSILKLKLTRLQTNPASTNVLNSASSISSVKQSPYVAAGRSNSELDRNSYIRSSMIAEAASVRASTNQLRSNSIDRDASVWANVPEELTPSKRPQILERNFATPLRDSSNNVYGSNISTTDDNLSTPILRDRRYKTLPRHIKSPPSEFCPTNSTQPTESKLDTILADQTVKKGDSSVCRITNLDDSNSTSHSSGGNKTISSLLNNEELAKPVHSTLR